MSFATCNRCGCTFDQDQPWKRICLSCWIEQKNAEDPTRRQRYQRQQQQHRPSPTSTPVLDKEMLRRMLQLCHPDKHGGSPTATTVTQYLLKLKESI